MPLAPAFATISAAISLSHAMRGRLINSLTRRPVHKEFHEVRHALSLAFLRRWFREAHRPHQSALGFVNAQYFGQLALRLRRARFSAGLSSRIASVCKKVKKRRIAERCRATVGLPARLFNSSCGRANLLPRPAHGGRAFREICRPSRSRR